MSKRKNEERREFFKTTFDALAVDGYIGDPNGQPAYAYIRVSSDMQAEDGRDGLPRQIRNVDEVAKQKGYRIAWDMVFADDASGYEFEHRPELTKLRREYKGKRANVVVMEHLDRLSRESKWQQGYLEHELRQAGIEPVYWHEFSSDYERAVVGVSSDMEMKKNRRRMNEGMINKAWGARDKDGAIIRDSEGKPVKPPRVTAKKRCYGYQFVDSKGNPLVKPGQDTHYAPYPPEVPVITMIFEEIGIKRVSLRSLANRLDSLFPAPEGAHWGQTTLSRIIKNRVYMGEFIARRFQRIKAGNSYKVLEHDPKQKQKDDTWIVVPVPPIVSAELWKLANDAIAKNKQTSRRNAKEPYLLTGLLRCAECHLACTGYRNVSKRENKPYRYKLYRCGSYYRTKAVRAEINCKQRSIRCDKLDNAVWAVVSTVLSEPEIMAEALDRRFNDDANAELLHQIGYLEGTIKELAQEESELYPLYRAKGINEFEYADRRRGIQDKMQAHRDEINDLQSRVLTADQVEAEKESWRAVSEQAKQAGDLQTLPFEVKQRVIKIMVNAVVLDVTAQTFKLVGKLDDLLGGVYSLSTPSGVIASQFCRKTVLTACDRYDTLGWLFAPIV